MGRLSRDTLPAGRVDRADREPAGAALHVLLLRRSGLDTLFVTSASIGLDAAALRAGRVFAISGLGVRGRPAGRFKG